MMEIVSREDFVRAACGCAGTPFHHQGRVGGVGLDCVGLIVFSLRACGAEPDDRTDYGRRPDGRGLVAALIGHGARPTEAIERGDILLFRYDGQPQHVAVALSSSRMVHAFAPAGCVVESEIGSYWQRRLVGGFRLPFKA